MQEGRMEKKEKKIQRENSKEPLAENSTILGASHEPKSQLLARRTKGRGSNEQIFCGRGGKVWEFNELEA